jgi:hypothetical protein
MVMSRYPKDEYVYEGWGNQPPEREETMPANVEQLETKVVGRKIVSAQHVDSTDRSYGRGPKVLTLTLDDGTVVTLADTNDCCAYTELSAFLLHPEMVDHVITGVETTDGFSTWHIYADAGDVLELTVGWSAGNPFYYGYGFHIEVVES